MGGDGGGGGVCRDSQHPGGPVTCQTGRASVWWGWGVLGTAFMKPPMLRGRPEQTHLGLKEEWGAGEGWEGSSQLNTPRTS